MLKKNFFRLRRAPSSGISLSGGQVSDSRLCRDLIVIVEHPHGMLYTHITTYLIWSGLSFKSEMMKIVYFETCCQTPAKGVLNIDRAKTEGGDQCMKF